MANFGLFCLKFLLGEECVYGDICLFHHKPLDGKKFLSTALDSDFVEVVPNNIGFATIVPQYFCGIRSKHHLSRLFCNDYRLSKHIKKDYLSLSSDQSHKKTSMESSNLAIPSTSKKSDNSEQAEPDHLSKTGVVRKKGQPQKSAMEHKKIKTLKFNVHAPEFVPKNTRARFNSTSNTNKRLCPYAERNGFCKYPHGECTYLHGDICDLCAKRALHPFNEDLRKKHTQECIKRHERDMEIAFAVARSKEKVCGICFEIIMQKTSQEQRFGILPSCNHCFCLSCIRKWRQSKQFDNKIIRSCPECRTPSDFVCPSAYWVDTKEDKDRLIERYKLALSKKDCKYFKQGRGNCPFGNKCFYKHCLQNGNKIDVGPPPSSNNSNNENFIYLAADEIIERLLMQTLLDDMPEVVEFDDMMQMLDLDYFSDTDETDYWSD